MVKLREYQVDALEVLYAALQTETSVLLEAACSAGKTLLFSKLIQRLLAENPTFRVLILMDREILVRQTLEKLTASAPELFFQIGTVCASVSDEKTLHKPITIASRQSLIRHIGQFEAVQLTVVDECHLMGVPKADDLEPSDQFGKLLAALWTYNPKMRLLGVTATPYRLCDGYIYGTKNTKGCRPYFSEVHHKIGVGELQGLGFLAPLTGKTVLLNGITERLGEVPLTAGEYNLGELSGIMEQGRHIKSAIETWKEFASDRKKTIAFCVTIEHAEKLTAAFNEAGIKAVAIHSEQDDLESYVNMKALRDGDGKVFCSVAKLTTGMDVVDINCILLCRPTKSAALYKQILGRGQRIADGKTDCLVLDLVGLNAEFGTDLDKLKVSYRKSPVGENGLAQKTCPQCEEPLHPAVRVCPHCGFEYPSTDFEADKPDMTDAHYGSKPPVELRVEKMFSLLHIGKKSQKALLKLRLILENLTDASLWLCFPDDGYTGYAIEKGRVIWAQLSGGTDYPSSAVEALHRADRELTTPDSVVVDLSGKWPEIKSMKVTVVPF